MMNFLQRAPCCCHFLKKNVFYTCKRNISQESGLSSLKVEKIEKLYRDAFSLTKGKPSEALLKALEQQATFEGVLVSGQEIQNFKYEQMVEEELSKDKKIVQIRGSGLQNIEMLNVYLDIFLSKNKLDEFLIMVQRNKRMFASIDKSILLRYVLICQKSTKEPRIELSDQMKQFSKIMYFYYQDNIVELKRNFQNENIQTFVDEILSSYTFYPNDFVDFKAAVKLVDSSLVFTIYHENLSQCDFIKRYPLTESLIIEKFKSIFPYKPIECDIKTVNAQLKNELNEFTQLQSISSEQKQCPNLRNYKSWLQETWTDSLYIALVKESKLYRKGDYNDYRKTNCPFLDEEIICLRTVAQHTINYVCEELVSQFEGIEVLKAASAIGNMVYKIYCKQHRNLAVPKYQEYVKELEQNPNASPQMVWEALHELEYHQFIPHWNTNVLHGIGGFLLNLVRINITFNKENCKLILSNGADQLEGDWWKSGDSASGVFTHTYYISRNKNHGYPVGAFIADPLVKRLIRRSMETRGYFYFETTEVPMLCPPKPWLYASLSPMLLCDVPFIRYAGTEWKKYFTGILKEHDLKGHLTVMKYGLDILGTLPWKVNIPILKKQIKVYNDGGSKALSIAPLFDKTFPERPEPAEGDLENVSMKAYYKHVNSLKKEQNEKFSIRCTQLYTLSLAESFSRGPFWQCYNLDFRGRVYPVAPHFNQMLGDPARGMLMFNEGAALGESGLRWLKIHLITTFGGMGKATFEEKEKHADLHLDQIMDSADNMCTESGWWAQSTEDPWQCLAACIEVTAALRSPDPAAYVTCLPVHMDGSCNGLQHYAALGRDKPGALKVSLSPSDRPGDVYSAVMEIVISLKEADCKAGNSTALKLRGKVHRKTIKQTVMTQVYGVTAYGARIQIRGRLKDQGLSDDDASECASYLSTLTFKAVGQLFTQAQQIKDWLNNSAYKIASLDKPVQWSTPLGLPCVQPYTKEKHFATQTPLQSVNSNSPAPDMPVNKRKQKSAFPPNFIHSQDSTHMVMTAIQCYHAGIPFAAVHDSFWTLPNHVDRMNKILRDQFLLMYSFDVLKQLKESFESSYPDLKLNPIPSAGELDISCVRDSTYFFS